MLCIKRKKQNRKGKPRKKLFSNGAEYYDVWSGPVHLYRQYVDKTEFKVHCEDLVKLSKIMKKYYDGEISIEQFITGENHHILTRGK